MRACSALTERLRSSPENQPETSFRRWLARIGPRVFASIGNLTPVSVPEKPACLVSRRQVSRLVSPPSCGRSLFDQAIGATPRRMGPAVGISDSDPLLRLALLVLGAGGTHFFPSADFRDAGLPPGVAGRPLVRLHLDDDDRGAVGLLGALEGALKLADRVDGLGERAHRLGVLGE